MANWYARPVLFVRDIPKSLAFNRDKLGFASPWQYKEDGEALVAQVERAGCELLMSCQWPNKLAFEAACQASGVPTQKGRWGYDVLMIADPDGNQLFFPYPDASGGE